MKNLETLTVKELINDHYFQVRVGDGIEELRKSRRNRPDPKPGYYYKRGWYEQMSEQGMLNQKFFLDSIELIWFKKSNLSSNIRAVIKAVCDQAAAQTFKYYTEQNNLEAKKSEEQ